MRSNLPFTAQKKSEPSLSDTPHAIRTPDSNLTGVFLLESKVQKWKNECEKMKKRQIWTPVTFFSTPVIYSNHSKYYF